MSLPDIDLGFVCDARRACTSTAIYIVSIHLVHNCKTIIRPGFVAVEGSTDSRLTVTGDTVWLMCPDDMRAAAYRIGVMVGEMYAGIPDDADENTVPHCDTCGRAIHDIDDVMTVGDI